MRKLILIACGFVAFMATVPLTDPASAASGQWCLRRPGAGTRCNYSTQEQCRATLSGQRGRCFQRQASR
jgi:hypothetical protein